jgi:peptidoglycan/LPS O-acetylase OafA/YrhL
MRKGEASTRRAGLGRGTLEAMKHESANLDLLRTIAVAFVLIDHLRRPLFPRASEFAGSAMDCLGLLGVAIFFVHTSLVLMQSLDRRQEGALAFYVRRFFRIYPLAIAIVLVASARNEEMHSAWALLSNVLLIQNITGGPLAIDPLWSLSFEVQMYLFLPVLYAATRSGNAVLKIAAMWFLTIVLALSHVSDLLAFAPCFMAGVMAYSLRHSRRTLSPVFLFGAVLVVAIVVPVLNDRGVGIAVLMWGACGVVGLMIPFTRDIRAGWLARFGAFVARYSYSIYLTHMYAITAGFVYFRGPTILQFVLFFAVLAAFVRVCDRWIEQPGIKLGARLADAISGSRNPIGSPQMNQRQT